MRRHSSHTNALDSPGIIPSMLTPARSTTVGILPFELCHTQCVMLSVPSWKTLNSSRIAHNLANSFVKCTVYTLECKMGDW